VDEIKLFGKEYKSLSSNLRRRIVGFSWTKGIQYEEGDRLNELEEVMEIVQYSLPQLESRVQLGYRLNNKYPQFLY
jgi:hypothetical protein